MTNGNLLIEIKQYAEEEGKALPARLFQRLILKAMAQVLDGNATLTKGLAGIETRLADVENRHCDEDKKDEKKDNRRWDLILLGVGNFVAIILAAAAFFKK